MEMSRSKSTGSLASKERKRTKSVQKKTGLTQLRRNLKQLLKEDYWLMFRLECFFQAGWIRRWLWDYWMNWARKISALIPLDLRMLVAIAEMNSNIPTSLQSDITPIIIRFSRMKRC